METFISNNKTFRLQYFQRIISQINTIEKYNGDYYYIIFNLRNGDEHILFTYDDENERDSMYEYFKYMKYRKENRRDEKIILTAVNSFCTPLFKKIIREIIAIKLIKEFNFIDKTCDFVIILSNGKRIYTRWFEYRTMMRFYYQFKAISEVKEIEWKKIEQIEKNNNSKI